MTETLAAPPKAAVAVPTTPYVGLTPFTERDAPFFFGREKERRIIAANLLASRLTLLYGASGVGKSSIIRAGVQRDFRTRAEEALAAGKYPESIVVVFTGWRDDPVAGLAECVATSVKELLGKLAPRPPSKKLRLDDLLVEWNRRLDESALKHAGASADIDEPIRTELLVVLDQFEQYFVYHPDEDGPGTFAVEFPRAVNRDDLRASFLISLREDAYTQLDRFEGRITNLFASNLRIEHLDEKAATAAIVKPVEKYNELLGDGEPDYEVEPKLVQAVIKDVRAGNIVFGQAGGGVVEHSEPEQTRVETPFLQLVMSRLWAEEQRKHSHVLRFETLRSLGGAERIVRRHLDEAMSALDDEERAVAARMFHQLVTPSGTRIVHSARDLAGYAEVPVEVAEPILEKLDERRILRTIDAAPGEKTPRFEIRHDVLAGAVVEWGRQYEEARRRAADEERQRQELAEQQKRLRTRMLLGAALALAFLIPAVIGGVYAWNARSDANARRDSVRSILAADDAARLLQAADPAESARAAYAAFKIPHSAPAAEDVLRAALVIAHRRTVFVGHKGDVVRARFSPDGTRIATASDDGTARIWDPLTGRSLARLVARGHGEALAPIREIAFSPDGLLLATAGADGRARLWDVHTGHLHTFLRGHAAPLNSVTFSRDGRLIVTSSDDGTARIWRTDNPDHALVAVLRGHNGPVLTASFNRADTQVITAGADGTARLWNLAHLRRLPLVLSTPARVEAASFSPDGRKALTASDDGIGRIWDTRTGQLLASLEGHRGPIFHAEFSPGGRLIVTAGADGTARLWQASDGKPAGLLDKKSSFPVKAASFSRDGAFVVTAQSNVARIWSTATKNLVTVLRGHSNILEAAAFSPDESLVVTAGTDGTARLWDAGTGKPVTVLPVGPGSVSDMAVDPDPKSALVALAGAGDAIQIWNLGSHQKVQTPLANVRSITSVAVSPDEKLVAATSTDGATRVIDRKSGHIALLPSNGPAHDVAFSPDGKLLIVAYEHGVRIWHLHDHTAKAFYAGGDVTHVAFSPDGKLVLTVASGSAVIRDLSGHKQAPKLVYRNGARVVDAAFGPAGELVVTGATDGLVSIWDAGRQIREFRRSRVPLTSVSFSSNGKFVVTTSSDGWVRVWEAGSGRLLAQLYEGGKLTNAVLSPDDRYLITASGAGVRVHLCEACLPIKDLLELGHWGNELRQPS